LGAAAMAVCRAGGGRVGGGAPYWLSESATR
jgi:hypothetical protein